VLEPDAFARIRARLGMERADELARVQNVLDMWYPNMVKAKRLHQGTLHLVAYNSPVASEIRMRQIELLEQAGLTVTRVQISSEG
jgi:hypothetical protein